MPQAVGILQNEQKVMILTFNRFFVPPFRHFPVAYEYNLNYIIERINLQRSNMLIIRGNITEVLCVLYTDKYISDKHSGKINKKQRKMKESQHG